MLKYVEFEEILKMGYFVMPLIGLKDLFKHSPLKDVFLQRTYYTIILIITFYCLFSGVIITVNIIVKGVFMERFMEMADIIGLGLGGVIAFSKSINVFLKRREIRDLLNELKEMWPSKDDDEDTIKCAVETVRNPTKVMKWFSIIEMIVPFLFLLVPIIVIPFKLLTTGEIEYILPFYDDQILEWRTSFSWFLLAYFFQASGSTFTAFNDPLTHGVMVALLTNLSVQCRLISLHLSKLVRSVSVSEENCLINMEDEERVNRELESIIERHKKMLRMCDKLQNIFSSILAVNFFLNSLIICQQILVITRVSVHDSARHVIYVFSVMLQMLLPCWYSTVLSEESYEISFGVYCSDWIRLPERHKNSLRILQTRAQREVTIKATAFFTTNVDTFITILKTTWSYFALLQTLYGE